VAGQNIGAHADIAVRHGTKGRLLDRAPYAKREDQGDQDHKADPKKSWANSLAATNQAFGKAVKNEFETVPHDVLLLFSKHLSRRLLALATLAAKTCVLACEHVGGTWPEHSMVLRGDFVPAWGRLFRITEEERLETEETFRCGAPV
jgi:hypothetical protein